MKRLEDALKVYDEFLDKYCKLAPGNFYGLYKEDLEKVVGLKDFLGF